MRYSLSSSLLASCLLLCLTGKAQQQNSYSNNQFKLAVKDYGLAGIWKTGDQFTTNYISRNRLLGELMVRYKKRMAASIR